MIINRKLTYLGGISSVDVVLLNLLAKDSEVQDSRRDAATSAPTAGVVERMKFVRGDRSSLHSHYWVLRRQAQAVQSPALAVLIRGYQLGRLVMAIEEDRVISRASV